MQIPKNKPGIADRCKLDEAEAEALKTAFDKLCGMFEATHRFTSADIGVIHKTWLEEIYEWAGQYRQVNVSKGDISFAAVKQIPQLMTVLEKGSLYRHTPCNFISADRVARALAEIHVELILIYPFPEGNGRTARILAALMASQAGLPILNFSDIAGRKKSGYFSAIHRGLYGDYKPMEEIFGQIILRSVKVRRHRAC